jgi:hypothetical protein
MCSFHALHAKNAFWAGRVSLSARMIQLVLENRWITMATIVVFVTIVTLISMVFGYIRYHWFPLHRGYFSYHVYLGYHSYLGFRGYLGYH